MKLSSSIIAVAAASYTSDAAFVPHSSSTSTSTSTFHPTSSSSSSVVLKGYLDDLSADLYKKDEKIDVEADSREANQMSKDQLDRYGPGNLDQFVDFEEFDGGDGQMGVAGDGTKGLDKSDFEGGSLAKQMNKSRMRSAKNAWGTSTGYADSLVDKGVDTARAQQLENWHNQREIQAQKQQQRYMTEQYDQVQQNAEADWRTLAKFGVERNQEFDMNEEFGAASIEGGEMEGTIELVSRPGGGVGYKEFALKNPYMGFADFRATITPESGKGWTVSPAEGSLMQREETQFTVRFRPEFIGVSEGYLIIETEDFKKVWKLVGSTG
mmetsp:Transcript_20737/g.31117  ORF Transcript_20737/g.31117 Transcript_20737/m.31117 type:complete len:324 (-) Transcript_20737:162-1133(-)